MRSLSYPGGAAAATVTSAIAATPVQQTTLNSSLIAHAQAKQSLEVQLAALATWETYIFGRLKTFKVPPLWHELRAPRLKALQTDTAAQPRFISRLCPVIPVSMTPIIQVTVFWCRVWWSFKVCIR